MLALANYEQGHGLERATAALWGQVRKPSLVATAETHLLHPQPFPLKPGQQLGLLPAAPAALRLPGLSLQLEGQHAPPDFT